MNKAARGEVDFTVGCGNVFRDLGLDSPNKKLPTAELALRIHDRANALGLNVTQAALRLGIPKHKASRLLRGYADGFSTEKLLTFLTKLGQDVRIIVSESPGKATTGQFIITSVRPVGKGAHRRRRVGVAARRRG